uniref:Uncharacterized protein n=1 Tax=Panagrolaimus sp. ES5 TaxID=591445 RepID=A0AC34FH87_9BILA
MIGLRIATVSPTANDEVEEGEIVEIDRAKKSPMHSDKVPLDRRPPVQSAEIPHDRLPPLKSAEIPLDRLPGYMMPKPVEAIEPTLDEHNASTATVANLPPSHPNYDPLLDDFDDSPAICNAEAFDLDDADDLLDDDNTRAEKKAKEDEDHVLKKFPDLKLTDNHPDEHMNQ